MRCGYDLSPNRSVNADAPRARLRPPSGSPATLVSLGAMSPDRSRFLRLSLIFASLHLAGTVVSTLLAFAWGMSRFDRAMPSSEPLAEVAIARIAELLSQPIRVVLESVGIVGAPPPVQWLLLGCNSVLWGVAAAAIWWRLTRRSTRTSRVRGFARSGPPVSLVR